MPIILFLTGTPGWIQTNDLMGRNHSLYSTELRGHGTGCGTRTRKTLRSGDFKSPAYTNSANPAN